MNTVLSRAAIVLAGLLLSAPSLAHAQDSLPTGRIVGRIIDARTGQGITDVGIQVVGTTMGVMSGVDGRFTLPRVRAGTVTLMARRLGYTPKTVTGILLNPGSAVEQNISLEQVNVQLQATVVTASAERGTVNDALDQQRTATGVVNSVTSEQIARSPDADAAQAVQRVSGVTVQDGRSVFVRGLGERYTTVSLNGARVPSPEPEKRFVPLDIFPAGLLQSITTAKTFTPDLPGDFSGAAVNIETREFPLRRVTTYSASVGFNDAAFGKQVLASPSLSLDWLGVAGSARQLPSKIAAAGDFNSVNTRAQTNSLISSMRNVWTPSAQKGGMNQSYAWSMGGQDPVLGIPLGYLATFSYSRAQEIAADQVYALTQTNTSGVAEVSDEYRGSTGRQGVLWGGMLTLSSLVTPHARYSFNGTFNRTSDNEARQDFGHNENLDQDLQRTTMRFIERTVWSTQLKGEHELSASQHFDWAVTGSGVRRLEPDRSDLLYGRAPNSSDPLTWVSGYEGARRTYGRLDEKGINTALNYRLTFGRQAELKFGGLQRASDRDARNDQYSMFANVPQDVARLRGEELVSAVASGAGNSVVFAPVSGAGSYTASDRQYAGYAMVSYPLGERVRVIGGARVENAQLDVKTTTVSGNLAPARLNNTDLLPSLAANIRVTENSSLRLSAAQTLSRPEYRELSPATFRDILGGQNVFGNPDLKRSLVQNYDARWEWYPDVGEVFSIAGFAKHFDKPIERTEINASNNALYTYRNAKAATNYGVELEARSQLDWLGLSAFTAFSNLTLMHSQIDLGSAQGAATNASRSMVGQAPYVVNAGLTFSPEQSDFSATALYNRVGRRIISAGALPLPDTYDAARNILDLSLRFPIVGSIAGKADARNLFDAPYRLTQGAVTRETYRAGRVLSFGIVVRP